MSASRKLCSFCCLALFCRQLRAKSAICLYRWGQELLASLKSFASSSLTCALMSQLDDAVLLPPLSRAPNRSLPRLPTFRMSPYKRVYEKDLVDQKALTLIHKTRRARLFGSGLSDKTKMGRSPPRLVETRASFETIMLHGKLRLR